MYIRDLTQHQAFRILTVENLIGCTEEIKIADNTTASLGTLVSHTQMAGIADSIFHTKWLELLTWDRPALRCKLPICERCVKISIYNFDNAQHLFSSSAEFRAYACERVDKHVLIAE